MILEQNLSCREIGAVLFVADRTSVEEMRARRDGVAGGGRRVIPVKTRINGLYGNRGKRIKEGRRRRTTSWNGLWPHLERRASPSRTGLI